MNIQKLKAAAYATYLNATDYTVLKNPKGTPSTVVRAIRHTQSIDPKTLDITESYRRVTKDFAKPNPNKTEEFLFRDMFAFYNKDTKKVDYKTQIQYSRYSKGEDPVHSEKNLIDDKVLQKRKFKDINKKIFTQKERVVDMSKAFLGYVTEKTVVIKKSLAERETAKYYEKYSKRLQNQQKQNFLSILLSNLKNR